MGDVSTTSSNASSDTYSRLKLIPPNIATSASDNYSPLSLAQQSGNESGFAYDDTPDRVYVELS